MAGGPRSLGVTRGPACKRVAGAVIQPANIGAIISCFIYFKISAVEERRSKVLDGETDRLGGRRKTLVTDGLPSAVSAFPGKQLGIHAVIKRLHDEGGIGRVHFFNPSVSAGFGELPGQSQNLIAGRLLSILV